MLGVISNKASLSLVTRTLRVLEETLGRREDEVYLLESITICLTAFLPLLEEVVRSLHSLGCFDTMVYFSYSQSSDH